MESDIKNVNLSFCCNKDWNTMRTVDEQKRFCESCQHQVIDFTKSTEKELKSALQSSPRVCGRFKRSQMSDAFLKYAASLVVASSVSLSCSPVAEQVQPDIPIINEETDFEYMGDIEMTGFVVYDSADTVLDNMITPFIELPDSID